MFELAVQREFCAAHAIRIHGRQEPVHGHNWRITLRVCGRELDSDGLLCDFHVLERAVDEVIGPLHNSDLNTAPAFERVNPTAENVARHIGELVQTVLPRKVRLVSVSVSEAPGCTATYRPPSPAERGA
jgi:6-pyruvoyltetrahydropterin/6-carboxytetrahydropterin synthase